MIATNFQVANTPDGYIVQAFVYMPDGSRIWKPLRNFGDRQSDAFLFCHMDCPKLSELSLSNLVKMYNNEVKYKRISARQFKKIIER